MVATTPASFQSRDTKVVTMTLRHATQATVTWMLRHGARAQCRRRDHGGLSGHRGLSPKATIDGPHRRAWERRHAESCRFAPLLVRLSFNDKGASFRALG